MPINCLFKCLINSEQSCSKNQFMVNSWINSWTLMFQKDAPFVLRPSSFVSSSLFLSPPLLVSLSLPLLSSLFLSLPPLLSFFNVHSVQPANFLKTKDLRKRHFWLQIFESRETAKIQNVRCKIGQWFTHFPADPTLHTPPETDPTYSAAKPCTM